MNLDLHLSTLDEEMASAWRRLFDGDEKVSISTGNILDHRADAILSPANSFGFMDGGIDLLYSHFFGWQLEEDLKIHLTKNYAGELPVGLAVVSPTQHRAIPFLVSAPTMRVPSVIRETVNVYLAFRAALHAIRRHNQSSGAAIHSLLSPALGAGVGAMPFDRVARQMHAAYREVVKGEDSWRTSARGVLTHHAHLLK